MGRLSTGHSLDDIIRLSIGVFLVVDRDADTSFHGSIGFSCYGDVFSYEVSISSTLPSAYRFGFTH